MACLIVSKQYALAETGHVSGLQVVEHGAPPASPRIECGGS